jgi:hypothetical protein
MATFTRIYMENTRSRNAFWEAWVVHDMSKAKCFNALRFGSLAGFGKLTCNPTTTGANNYALRRKSRKDSQGKLERDYVIVHDQEFEANTIEEFVDQCNGENARRIGIQLFIHLGYNAIDPDADFDPTDEVEPTAPVAVTRNESWGSW